MPLRVDAIDHLVINVKDVGASASWYQRVLGMEREDFISGAGPGTRTALKFGRQKINLRPLSASKEEWFTADRETAGSQDLCFLTLAQPQQVLNHLRDCGIKVEAGPVQKHGAQGTLISVYCRDPDGSLIELASYIG